jgi:dTDP-4-amino-4,6-dideoxygalactose transaminase
VRNQLQLPQIPGNGVNNGHMFYIVCRNLEQRLEIISALKEKGIQSAFHYLSLHKSPYYHDKHDGRELPMSDHYSDCLLRLPFHNQLTDENCAYVISTLNAIELQTS